MSIESLAIALHHSRSSGSAKLVLLGIANHDGDGGSWPSVETLSVYASINDRNVQIAVHKLERLGEIEVYTQQGGTAATPDHTRPNLYRFLLKCPPNCDRTMNHRLLCSACSRPLRPAERYDGIHKKCAANRVSVATPGVGSDTPPVSVATPEPPVNPSPDRSSSSSVSNRGRATANDWPVVEHFYANSTRICREQPDPQHPTTCAGLGHLIRHTPLVALPLEYTARLTTWQHQHEAVSA